MTVAEVALIAIGGVTLVAVLAGLALQVRSYWLDRARRQTLSVVHLHLEVDEDLQAIYSELTCDHALEMFNYNYVRVDEPGVLGGVTRCGQLIRSVTSHPATIEEWKTRPRTSVMAYTAKSILAYDEVVLHDQCAECWQSVAIHTHSPAEECKSPAEPIPLPQTGDLAVHLKKLLDELGIPVIECPQERNPPDCESGAAR